MKRTAIALTMMLAGVALSAQSISDGLTYATNDYEGTARTIAMGNAFTALGGDIGAVTINPAGTAVSRRSQFSITPSTYISINKAKGTELSDGTVPGFGSTMKNSAARLGVPSSLGFSLNFNTGRSSGLKNWTVGVTWNTAKSYSDGLFAKGVNYTTSFTGSLAADASGILQDATYEGYNKSVLSSYDGGAPYYLVTAYNAGIISNLPKSETAYIGVAESLAENGDIAIGDNGLLQTYGRNIRGEKRNVVLNFGFNLSDIVFLGFNVGYSDLRYRNNEYLREEAVELSDVLIQYDNGKSYNFNTARRTYTYKADGTGLNAKLGVIYTPVSGLRLGAAIELPSYFTIKERLAYGYEVNLKAAEGSTGTYDSNMSDSGMTEEYDYRLISPVRTNFGIAYTFGQIALISADYELCNYGSMRFSTGTSGDDSYSSLNKSVRNSAGVSLQLRLGTEIKPRPWLALRAGYNLTTSPNRYLDNNGKKRSYRKSSLNSFAFGVGFTTPSRWFFDLGCRTSFYRAEYIIPYADYIFKTDETGDYLLDDDGYKIVKAYTPEIRNIKRVVSLFFTVGINF